MMFSQSEDDDLGAVRLVVASTWRPRASRWEVTWSDDYDAVATLLEHRYDAALIQYDQDSAQLEALLKEFARRCAELPCIVFGNGWSRQQLGLLRALGASQFFELPSPEGLDSLVDQVAIRIARRRKFELVARQLVGVDGLKEAQDSLRRIMFLEAHGRSGGNKTAIARLLRVSRAAVQKIVRDRA